MSRRGKTLAGRYLIEALLGSGGMGDVYSARHLLLGEPVAIKFLKVNDVGRPEALARMLQEARAAMRLRSEHVVRVHDVVVDDDGCPCLVMELLVGIDLAESLKNSGSFEPAQAVDYVLEACQAIAEAHRMGIVHRDLKPSNLYLAQTAGGPPNDPILKVLDFGIAKETRLTPRTLAPGSDAIGPLTDPFGPLGSPLYMSPEQMESASEADARADVWALGVTLFELVTGKQPFGGTSLIQVYTQMISRGRPPWRSALESLPQGLADVIVTCLQPNRDERYANAHELGKALAPYASRRSSESAARVQTARDATAQEVTFVTSKRPSAGNEIDGSARPNSESNPALLTATLKSRAAGPPESSVNAPAGPRALSPARRARKALMLPVSALALVLLVALGWSRRAGEARAPVGASPIAVREPPESAARDPVEGAGIPSLAAPGAESARPFQTERRVESEGPSKARGDAPAIVPTSKTPVAATRVPSAAPSLVASNGATRPAAHPKGAPIHDTETPRASTADTARPGPGPTDMNGMLEQRE